MALHDHDVVALRPPVDRLAGLRSSEQLTLQDDDGQILEGFSISAGLDYPGIGPEHAWLHDQKRVEYTYATDDKALEAFMKLARLEGIIPALIQPPIHTCKP